MNTNHTDITIVLDRSGSMASIAADTIGGFNRFVEDQQKAPGTADLTLYQFDHEFETVIDAKKVQSVKPLDHSTFVPRGNTALLGAIGRAITETGARLSAMRECKRPAHVVLVIITDGQENNSPYNEWSRNYTLEKVKEMISHQQDKYQWEIVFQGANLDAVAVGTGMGVLRGQTMTYANNSAGVCGAFKSTSDNLVQMRSGTKKDMSYTASQLKEQEDAGA